MKREMFFLLPTLLICFVCSLFVAQAQEATATILGVVQDQQSAVLPGVTVTARNVNTNQVRTTLSDDQGLYRIPSLPVGTYEVSVEMPGFKKFRRTDITLTVNQQARIDVSLEVGDIAQEVLVSGDAPLVETEKSAISGLVDTRRVVDLPLNGRNPLELSFILPGVVTPEPGAVSTLNFSVSGQRGQANNFMLDGADNNDTAANFPSANPSPDMVQEFRILKNSYPAEFGRNAGAVINVITKSGGNDFHGTLFEFHRNRPLNSRNFFDITKPLFIQNQFGGTIGGPIRRDKLFFFGGYQGTRRIRGITGSNVFVPTALQRQGNFSELPAAQQPRDPSTGQPFPGGIIPQNRLDPLALSLLQQYVPLPNLGTNQFTANPPERFRTNQYLAKVDYNLTHKHTLYGRYFYTDGSTFAPFAFGIPTGAATLPGFGANSDTKSHAFTLNLASVLSPTRLNEFRATYQRVSLFSVVPVNKTTPAALGFTGITPQNTTFAGPPLVNVSNAFVVGNSVQGPQGRNDDTFQVIDTYNFQMGGHSFKAGTDLRRYFQSQVFVFVNNGSFNFTGQFTNNPTGDFLLGLPFTYQQNANFNQYLRYEAYDFYFQDDYKVRRNLTLNLGIRYEINTPTREKFNHINSFRPGQQSTVFPNAPLGLLFPGDTDVTRGTVPLDLNNWGPRVGFAWDPFNDGKTSVRSGYGIFYDTLITELQLQFLSAQPFAIVDFLSGNVPGFANPFAGRLNPFPLTGVANRFLTPVTGTFLNPDSRNPYSHQYSLSIQREIIPDLKAEVAYVGSRGTKLIRRRQGNPALYGPGATPANIQARRIYNPLYGSITMQDTNANSNYNSLQTSVEKRFNRGFGLLGSYTFSKSIDNNSSLRLGTPQDPFNAGLDRSISDFDVRHRAVFSYLWELPFYRDQAGVIGHLIGGWQVSGTTTFASGFPFTVSTGTDRSLRGIGSDRPNLIADPNLPTDRPHGELVTRYFNTAAFVGNNPGENGNAGRNILRGPGFANTDLSFIKRVKLPGALERHRLQIRGELFNAFNRVNFNNPVSGNIASPNLGRIQTARDPRIAQLALKYEF